MFHCSNYTWVWDILTSHYQEVPLDLSSLFLLVVVDLKENILVLDGDRFVEDPVLVLRSVERFLDLPPFFSDQHFTFSGTSHQDGGVSV